MATSFESANVKCPFYKRNDQRKIFCEGIDSESQMILEYEEKEKARKKIRESCSERYKDCEVYKAILKKYGRN